MDQYQPSIPWYKTLPGKTFLLILAILGGLLLAFGLMVAYYAITFLQGGGDDLARQFQSGQFTEADATIPGGSTSALTDITSIIGSHTPTLGNRDSASVQIVAFLDFECPYCQQAYEPFQKAIETYGPISYVVIKHFPLTAIHPLSARAAEASLCAHSQGQFWPYYEQLFASRDLSESALFSHAQALGLNMTTFQQCTKNNVYDTALDRDLKDGTMLGVRGTPTFFVNGIKYEGVLTTDQWDAILLKALTN